MSTLDMWFQDDFSGGENSLVPPDSIGENEVAELVNMLPRSTDTGIHVRTAPSQLHDFGGEVKKIFSKRKTDGSSVLIGCVVEDGQVKAKDFSVTPSPKTIHTFGSSSSFRDVHFSDWDGNKILFSDGANGLYVYNSDGNAATKILDGGVEGLKIGAFTSSVPTFESMMGNRQLDYVVSFGGLADGITNAGRPMLHTYTPAYGGRVETRRNSTAYTQGAYVKVPGFDPLLLHAKDSTWGNGVAEVDIYNEFRLFRCLTAGTTAASSPVFTGAAVGETVVDGGVTWVRCTDGWVDTAERMGTERAIDADTNSDGLADGFGMSTGVTKNLSGNGDGSFAQRFAYTAQTGDSGTLKLMFSNSTYPVDADGWFKLDIRMKGFASGCSAYLGFECLDANGNTLGHIDGTPVTLTSTYATHSLIKRMTIPNTARVRVKLGVNGIDYTNPNNSFDIYVDSFSLTRWDYKWWTVFSHEAVTGGIWDGVFKSWAAQAAVIPYEVIVRFNHEMNLSYPINAENWHLDDATRTHAKWIAMYRRFVDAVREYYVENNLDLNVKFMWCPNNTALGTNWSTSDSYYPGNDYVDYVGVDGYLWTYQNTHTFDAVFAECLPDLEAHGKPIIIAETASTNNTEGKKAAYITSVFSSVVAHPLIEGVCWFNFNKEYDWRIEADSASTEAWSDGVSAIVQSLPAPSGRYLIQHNGRLFMATSSANGSFSTLAMCGSSDATTARYENWSGTAASAGGSVDIVPYGTDIKGLASSFGGVLIFKETTIHLFSYSDAYAPWDAANGGQVDLVQSGIGCLSHDSIVSADGITYFIGRTDAGDVGLFSIDGTSIERLSLAVPRKMKNIISDGSKKLMGEVHDNYYILAAADSQSGEVGVVAVYDIIGSAWATFDMVDVTSIYRAIGDDFVMFGTSSGVVYRYPSTSYIEPDGEGVYFKIVTRRLVGDTPAHDAYYRLARLRGGADVPIGIYLRLVGARGEQYILEPVEFRRYGTDVWDATDNSVWDDSDGTTWTVTYDSEEHQTEANFRSQGAQLVMDGTALGDTYLEYVAVGSRPRRAKNANT